MTNNTLIDSVDVNSRQSIIAAIYLGIIGPAVFIVQPGFVQGLVEFYGFNEQQAGYVASIEMWGIALVTLLLTVVASRFNWRSLLLLGTLLAAVGNFLSATTDDMTLFKVLRFITGAGSGVLISLTFTIIGLTNNPDRNFGFMIMWILVYGAIGFVLMPFGYAAVGMQGVLVFFGLFCLSALPFIRFLPSSGDAHAQVDQDAVELASTFKLFAIAAMFIYFLAQGVVWAYLFLIGTNAGGIRDSVTTGLTLSQFLGVAGALLAALVANRIGRISPLTVGIALSVASLAFMFGGMTAFVYASAVCLFNFAWNMTHPYLLATMASLDRTGRVVVYAVAAQMVGLALGPALAASILGDGQYANIVQLGMVLFTLSFIAILLPLIKARSQHKSSTL